jgi:hypothetical protein
LDAKVKEKTMANKNFLIGILAMVLVFGMTVVGCDDGSTDENVNDNGYTFEFKIKNHSSEYWGNIIKVEFINGSEQSDPVLETHDVNIALGETSEIFKVSGFTNNRNVSEPANHRRAGLRLTFDTIPRDDNPKLFSYILPNNQKISIYPLTGIYVWHYSLVDNW